MIICVYGLWHLGTVTAACLAKSGHRVVGLDPDPAIVEGLRSGRPSIFEPGLEDLVREGLARGMLSFTSDPASALAAAEIVWVTFDTPVDENDRADGEFVVSRIQDIFPHLPSGVLVLISSQLRIGTTAGLEKAYRQAFGDRTVRFACIPENLRLGKAIDTFIQPDRVVAGIRDDDSKRQIAALLSPITDRIEWMSVESAEMTKHALNSFLALSIVFTNELAIVCEMVGADAKEVERGLKTDARIGPGAYLSPGSAFAGGTLARDLAFLESVCREHDMSGGLFAAAIASNEAHKNWTRRHLADRIGDLHDKKIAVLGLTYKAGTSTLRRSASVELCQWLAEQGACVWAHDPAITVLPEELKNRAALGESAEAVLRNADALIVATAWPEYRRLTPDLVVAAMHFPLVLDAGYFLADTLGTDRRIRYYAVGRP